jgi:thiol-disulfide isomerase/thioredoxin
MKTRCLSLMFVTAWIGLAQQPAVPATSSADVENKELTEAITDANNSNVDILRALEGFLKKHPQSLQRHEIERLLARAAVEVKDDRRTVLYGERVLESSPEDMLLLDRVARGLLALGGRENATASLKYSGAFADYVRKLPPADGVDSARKQEERDRGLARALLYESRAHTVLGEYPEAERLAAESFSIYPSEEAARESAAGLERLGRLKDALARLAEAFAVPDTRASESDRADDRRKLGEMYRKVHHSEKGIGDLILAAYDRTAAQVEQRKSKLLAMDPNASATEPMQFTISGLDGSKLPLSNLKGRVVVVDFWATWCQPCRVQHPLYEKVKARFKERPDVVFLAVDTDSEEDRSKVGPFLDNQKWSRNVYFEDGLQRLLNVSSIPTTVLFDKGGHVASRMNGFLPDKFVDQLTQRIESALSETP